jgi:hypothetical protein
MRSNLAHCQITQKYLERHSLKARVVPKSLNDGKLTLNPFMGKPVRFKIWLKKR